VYDEETLHHHVLQFACFLDSSTIITRLLCPVLSDSVSASADRRCKVPCPCCGQQRHCTGVAPMYQQLSEACGFACCWHRGIYFRAPAFSPVLLLRQGGCGCHSCQATRHQCSAAAVRELAGVPCGRAYTTAWRSGQVNLDQSTFYVVWEI
jgi:hypothetical protein